MHWARKAKIVKQIRTAAAYEARRWVDIGAKYPGLNQLPQGWMPQPPVAVSLIWEVTTRHRRDVGAAGPTLKAWIDGMVDGGLLTADTHDVVAEERLRIEYGTRKGVRVEIAPIERKDTTT
jgi:crossover junction endodeoxyribonuclease RusA